LKSAGAFQVFQPKPKVIFKVKITKYENKGSLKIVNYHRDSEGDVYVLIHTKDTFPKINNIPTCRQESSCKTGEIYTIARIKANQKLMWALNVKKAGPGFSVSDFNVSPQGNVSLVVAFKGTLTIPQSLKSFKSIGEDTLVLFFKKKTGSLIKTLHFSGAKNESGGKIIYGTGGEVLFSLISNSASITFDNGKYFFANGRKDITKKLLVSLKENLFPKWFRSIEPASESGETFYDEGNLVLGLNLNTPRMGLYKPGKPVIQYYKNRNLPPQGVVLSLDKDGNKIWDIRLKHSKYKNSVLDTKVYPNGSIGVYANTQKVMNIGNQKTISITPDLKSPLLLLKFNKAGLLSQHSIMESNPIFNYFGKHTDAVVLSAEPKQEDVDQFIHSSGSQSVQFQEKMECENLLILDKELKVEYKQDNETCLDIKNIKKSKITITEGHLEILSSNEKSLVLINRFKYGEEGLSDEIIPGLAYTPNFIHEELKGEKPKYSLSYAIPEKVHGSMVFFVPAGVGHKDFLLNPLVQSSLNLSYFRGYSVFTVWSEDKVLSGKRMEKLFKGLIDDKVISLDWKWYMQAYGKRANQIVDIYPHSKTGTLVDRVLDPLAYILWNPDTLPSLEWGRPNEAYKTLADRSRATIQITSSEDLQKRKQAQRLHEALLDLNKVSSHIHQDSQLITKDTFSTLLFMGKEKSKVIYNDLKKNNCLKENGRFKKNFQGTAFQNKCCKKIKIIRDLTPAEQEVALKYFSNHVHAKQFTPYYDKEIYTILEGGNIKP
ncbi:MAG: hypothetical protein NXH75_09250, partial [Halobacteriovoraceae bacterium]|nr:hypothetical protein [Halobacteriovoraceae bacterium]